MTNNKLVSKEDAALQEEEGVYEDGLTIEDRAILDNIDSLIKELKGCGISGKPFGKYSVDELSRIAGSLAVLRDSLINIIAKAKSKKGIQEASMKLTKGSIRKTVTFELTEQIGKKPANDIIKDGMEQHLFRARARLVYLEELFDKLNNRWWSINTVLDVIQSRINVLLSSKADTNKMNNTLEHSVSNIQP